MTGDRHAGRRHRPRELVVADREELLFLLGEAAELEHAVCCSYLFAAFSLRTDPADGLAGASSRRSPGGGARSTRSPCRRWPTSRW